MSRDIRRKPLIGPTFLVLAAVTLVIALNWALPIIFLANWNDRGGFGQLFGPASALFTGMGFAGLLYTIRLQQAQIEMAQDQATEAGRSQAETRNAIERQLRILTEQTTLLSNSLVIQAQSSVADRQLQLDRMFVEFDDIRECFLNGMSVGADDPRYLRVLAACQCLANYFDTYFLQRGKFAQLYSDEAWVDYIVGHFATSPMLCCFVVDHADWYTSTLVAHASFAASKPVRSPPAT
jgi:hypothetical protein